MKTQQLVADASTTIDAFEKLAGINPQLVTVFGDVKFFGADGLVAKLHAKFPGATLVGCSTAGEISRKGVTDGKLVVTAVAFANSNLKTAASTVTSMDQSFEAGVTFAKKLDPKDLKAIFLLGPGTNVNGSGIIAGIKSVVGDKVVITGGLAGDNARFEQTFTVLNGEVYKQELVGFGIYGDGIEVGYGSMGGWEAFGPVRKVTKSHQNIMYELDGEPALLLYKKYLGQDKVRELPGSALMYPFALLKDNQDKSGIIRTILGVNEEDQSVIFAGDIPQDGFVRLMHANNDRLVEGATHAAEETVKKVTAGEASSYAILISCVGRKLIMGVDVEDELDAVNEVLGEGDVSGFYSYGEICPESGFSECKLHNQTMTITYFREKA